MEAREFFRKLRENIAELNRNRDREFGVIAADLSAQIKLRIQTTGRNASGQLFAPYTPEYARVRTNFGAQTGYVDLTVTGRLMANIQARKTGDTESSTTYTIGPDSQENIDKLRGQLRKRGQVLTPSADEIQIASDSNLERVLKIFDV